jgi:hypothetical protein
MNNNTHRQEEKNNNNNNRPVLDWTEIVVGNNKGTDVETK